MTKKIHEIINQIDPLIFSTERHIDHILKNQTTPTYPTLSINNLKETQPCPSDSIELKIKQLIKSSFRTFDRETNKEIEFDDLKPCIYNLGITPCEIQMKNILSYFEEKFVVKPKKTSFKK